MATETSTGNNVLAIAERLINAGGVEEYDIDRASKEYMDETFVSYEVQFCGSSAIIDLVGAPGDTRQGARGDQRVSSYDKD
jgi:hypothetical protein